MSRRPAGPAVVTTLLAAAAGVVDLWALVALGGAFAGVVTGNLVVAAGRLATGDLAEVVPAALAVGGFAAGAVLAGLAARTPAATTTRLLAAEVVVLVALALGWGLPAAHSPVVTSVLLVGAAVAMGVQSVAALDLGESTTYMTGTLTGVVRDVVAGGRVRRLAGLRVLAAVIVGAGVAGLLLAVATRVVPAVATVLVGLAALVDRRTPARPGASRR